MSNVDSKQAGPVEKPAEVSLDEIDKILAQDDPDFSKQLGDIQSVGVPADVEIESAVAGEETLSTEESSHHKSWWERVPLLAKLSRALFNRWARLKSLAWQGLKSTWSFLRTSPLEFFRYLKAMAGVLGKRLKLRFEQFNGLPRAKKIGALIFVVLVGVTGFVLSQTIKGRWLPKIYKAELTDFSRVADRSWEVQSDADMVNLLRAFPQEEYNFLFPKVIVNLKRGVGHPNPMGAFEFYVVLDAKETALEVQARQHELHDRLQRAVEDQTYTELDSPLGRKRLKDILRSTLNDLVTQGFVQDVLIKTYILKP